MKWICVLGLFFMVRSAIAQTPPATDTEIESRFETTEQIAEITDYTDPYILMQNKSINLNTCVAEDLEPFYFLNKQDKEAIVHHRVLYGNYVDIKELQAVEGLNEHKIRSLLPFVLVETHRISTGRILNYMRAAGHEFNTASSVAYPFAAGYSSFTADSQKIYPGMPYLLRIKWNMVTPGWFYAGGGAEKDPGESFFHASNPQGFDFHSFHLFVKGNGLVKSLAAGDFRLAFGQGLIAGGFLSGKKSALVLNTQSDANGISPSRSFGEGSSYRGLGITLGKKRLSQTIALSYQRIDAAVQQNSGSGADQEVITSIISGGNHRTLREIETEKNLWRAVLVQNTEWRHKKLKLGSSSALTAYELPFMPQPAPHKSKGEIGNILCKTGLNGQLFFRNLNFFGEMAIASNYTHAAVSGVLASLGPNTDITLLYRNYSPGYGASGSSAFGENSQVQNENGWYMGCRYKISRMVELSGYADFYRIPFYSYRVDGPYSGSDLFVQGIWKLNKQNVFTVRIRNQQEYANHPERNYHSLFLVNLNRIRVQTESVLHPHLRLQMRLEWIRCMEGKTRDYDGSLVYLDLSYKKQNKPLKLNGRITWFHTEDYRVRIYAVERSPGGVLEIPVFNGSGFKIYGTGMINASRKLNIQLRWSYIKYYDKAAIGSGWDEVTSDNLKEIQTVITWRIR